MIYILSESEIPKTGDFSLFFYTTWMPYLKKMTQLIEKVEAEYPNHKFYCIDVQQFKELVKKHVVTCVPTFCHYINNHKVDVVEGLVLTKAFKTNFNKLKKDKNEKK